MPGATPDQVAGNVVAMVEGSVNLFQSCIATAPFSDLVAAHPNQVERGAYAITLVTSLIHEGNVEGAYQLAKRYSTGQLTSCSILKGENGESFHELAMKWIESNHRPMV
ncbi:hypothetical protein [Piscinibacter sp. XHJ-5]|uniref:hypothetical protein n=1 Tax=Piscinibacter sp. XHJ-5 TaxID=3037797 RepID=UPI0024533BE6|nr:hypothetical protein [Piscinibacter sp. XHJ-5]